MVKQAPFLLTCVVIFADVSDALICSGSLSSRLSARRANSGGSLLRRHELAPTPRHTILRNVAADPPSRKKAPAPSDPANSGGSPNDDGSTESSIRLRKCTSVRPLLAGAVALPFAVVPRKLRYLALALLATSVLVSRRRSIFYPGSSPDPDFSESLPPGTIDGCPFIGPVSMFSGFDKFFLERSEILGKSTLFKYYSFGMQSVMVAGSKRIKTLLDREFRSSPAPGAGSVSKMTTIGNSDLLIGDNSLSAITDSKQEYKKTSRLVGASMSPKSVSEAMPALQIAAQDSVKKMIDSDKNVKMVDVFHRFTLDVAWRQIVGLNLKSEDEIEEFVLAVQNWMGGFLDFLFLFAPRFIFKSSKAYQAKLYLTAMMQKKIDDLEQNGPDGSTLSGMFFATEDGESIVHNDILSDSDQRKRLTRDQIIDNVFVLIIAGSETSSNTLTNIMYMMGKNRSVWEALVAEQNKIVAIHGSKLTKEILDEECPYLAAVIKEAMRIVPPAAGDPRRVDQTMILDGKQIPKKWLVWYGIGLTHALDPTTWREDGSHMDPVKGFQPERWLKEQTKPTTEYMPFGAGVRFCLGYNLALVEMKIYLAVMARMADFTLVEKNAQQLKWKEGIIRTPADGVMVKVTPVKQEKEGVLSPDHLANIEEAVNLVIEGEEQTAELTKNDRVLL